MAKVYIITKNADFTEGRGAMLFHSVWDSIEKAISYVMEQPGIYGSTQKETIYKNLKGRYFNGYEINEVEIRTEYESSKKKDLEKIINDIKNKLSEAEKELSLYD